MTCTACFRALVAAAALQVAAGTCAGELLREQDAAGRVRVIREVSEDAAGNWVNHGLWQQLAGDGRVVAEGRYELGRRTGAWRRELAADEILASLAELARGFDAPLVSCAEFAGGKVVGAWTIADARGRRCASIEMREGVRHGRLEAWSPGGQLIRSETYSRGVLDGPSLVWSDEQGQLMHGATWVRGWRLVRSLSYFAAGEGGADRAGEPRGSQQAAEGAADASRLRSEGEYLVGPQTVAARDDFWSGAVAEYRYGHECLPHGAWRQWHANGQLAAEGRYSWGQPVGAFVWRHSNGQKAALGSYAGDGSPIGQWQWWSADGVRLAGRTIGAAGTAGPRGAVSVARAAARPADSAVR